MIVGLILCGITLPSVSYIMYRVIEDVICNWGKEDKIGDIG